MIGVLKIFSWQYVPHVYQAIAPLRRDQILVIAKLGTQGEQRKAVAFPKLDPPLVKMWSIF